MSSGKNSYTRLEKGTIYSKRAKINKKLEEKKSN